MQFSASRRSGKTYGKASKNVVVHDLFDYRGNHDNATSAESSSAAYTPITAASPKPARQDATETTPHQTPASLSKSLFSSNVSDKQLASELKKSLIQDTSLFEVESSEDGASTDSSDSRASKRRRIIQPLKGARTQAKDDVGTVMEPKLQVEHPGGMEKRKRNKTTEIAKKSTITTSETRNRPEKATSSKENSKALPIGLRQPQSRLHSLPKSTGINRTSRLLGQSEKSGKRDHTRVDTSGYTSDNSQLSPRLDSKISSTKQFSPANTESDLSSPSQLGMTGLRLSATKLSPGRQSPDVSSDGSVTRKRNRRRLIDRLDVPLRGADNTSEDPISDTPLVSTQVKKDKSDKTHKKAQMKDTDHQAPRSMSASRIPHESQNPGSMAVKPRMTYATQRSHLSDMVNDSESAGEPSQKNTDELLLSLPISNLASQLELEDDENDDQIGVGRLKSIHELRQAGANNRFDREVDALLEDIDVGDRSSKALRLQALMKLIVRLKEPSFLHHVAGSGRVQRLVTHAGKQLDLPSSILLMTVLSSLAAAENISLETIGQVFRAATELAPDMLKDDRSLAKIAKDRKQNLSKAMIGDLANFEKSAGFVDGSSEAVDLLISDMAALSCLERSLRKLVQLGSVSARVSTLLYTRLLELLQLHVQSLNTASAETVTLTKLQTALALLELFSLVVDDADLHISDDNYELLGDSLAGMIEKTGNSHNKLEQGVLRVVVSLSNNKPRMCRLLGHSAINKAAFNIIDTNFLLLASQAESEETLDESKLDSVVLALGCLLNFAECDSTLRSRLSRMRPGKDNYVEQLVSIFNSQVSKVDEAMTKEQSQISVAFGYLSMLLCTLSLDRIIRTQITQLLKSKSFEEVCTAAEKFFSHLRTLENMSEDDASISTFTVRFGAILDTVRGPGI